MVSGRTAKQGEGLEEGKTSAKYTESVNRVQLNPEDAEKLGLKTETSVRITTENGSVTVHWAPDKGLDSGTVFFPYGPWANQVCASSTSSTGMPLMKGIPAQVEASKEEVNTLEEIVEKLRRGA